MANNTQDTFDEPFPIGTKVKASNPNHRTYIGWLKRYIIHDDGCVMAELHTNEVKDFQNRAVLLRSHGRECYKLEAVPHGK